MEIITEYAEQLSAWYAQPLGQALAALEQQACANIVTHIYGYHALQIGCTRMHHWLDASPIKHRIYMSLYDESPNPTTSLQGEALELPLQTDSVDLVCLPHSLEAVYATEDFLEEVLRVLIPDGHLLIVGFNRFSSWGLWRLLTKQKQQAPWNAKFVGLTKLRSFLLELDCDIIKLDYLFMRPPVSEPKWLERLRFLEALGFHYLPAGVFILWAQKKSACITPIKPLWRRQKVLAATCP